MHRRNRYSVDSAIGVGTSYRLYYDLSDGQGYATFEQVGPKVYVSDLTLAKVLKMCLQNDQIFAEKDSMTFVPKGNIFSSLCLFCFILNTFHEN